MDRNLADTKSKAQSMIMAGQVYVNDKIITKSGNSFNENSKIKIKQLHPPWVSRGAFKLLKVPPLAAMPPEESLNPIFFANHLHNDSSSKVILGDNS